MRHKTVDEQTRSLSLILSAFTHLIVLFFALRSCVDSQRQQPENAAYQIPVTVTQAPPKPAPKKAPVVAPKPKPKPKPVPNRAPVPTPIEPEVQPPATPTQVDRAVPELIYGTAPVYPKLAQHYEWEGTIVVDLFIDSEGDVASVSVVQSTGHALLDNAYVTSVKKEKFKPKVRHGKPVEGIVRRQYTYKIQ